MLNIPRWTGRPLSFGTRTLRPYWFRILAALLGLTALPCLARTTATQPGVEPTTQTRVSRALDRRLSLDLQGTPLAAVIGVLQDITGLDISIPRQARLEALTLRLHEATVRETLEGIAKQLELNLVIARASLRLEAPRNHLLDVLDVSDLLWNSLDPRGDEAEIQAGLTAWIRLLDDTRLDEEALLEHLRDRMNQDSLAEPANLEVHRGQLIAFLPVAAHNELREVLEDLRRARGPQVWLEARFVAAVEPGLDGLSGESLRSLGVEPRPILDLTIPESRRVYQRSPISVAPIAAAQVPAAQSDERSRPVVSVLASRDQRARVLVEAQRAFISGYELSLDGNIGLLVVEDIDPIVTFWKESLDLVVRPRIAADGSLILEVSGLYWSRTDNAPAQLVDFTDPVSLPVPEAGGVLVCVRRPDGQPALGVSIQVNRAGRSR